MKARVIPENILKHQPFFSFAENEVGMVGISTALTGLCPTDFGRAYSLGETVVMACFRIIRNSPPRADEVIPLEQDTSRLDAFVRRYGIARAPEYFRLGFYSAFEAVALIALECPHLVPALWRVVDRLTPESLESRVLVCLLAEAEPADWVGFPVPCLGDLIEAEYRAMAGEVAA
jgi:hypothetical protein